MDFSSCFAFLRSNGYLIFFFLMSIHSFFLDSLVEKNLMVALNPRGSVILKLIYFEIFIVLRVYSSKRNFIKKMFK